MANRIKELRIGLSLTQSELAKQIGLNQSAIGKYERDELEPSISTLKKLSILFECSIDYLLGHSDDFGSIVIKNEKSLELSPKGKEMMEIFNALGPEYQSQVLEYARYFAERSKISLKRSTT